MVKASEEVIARLEMTVEYEDLPTDGEIRELLDKAREYGAVKRADLTILKTVKKSVL